MGSDYSLQGVAIGTVWNMDGGSRGQCLGVHDFLWPRDGLAVTSHLSFVLWLSGGLSCPCDLSHLPLPKLEPEPDEPNELKRLPLDPQLDAEPQPGLLSISFGSEPCDDEVRHSGT